MPIMVTKTFAAYAVPRWVMAGEDSLPFTLAVVAKNRAKGRSECIVKSVDVSVADTYDTIQRLPGVKGVCAFQSSLGVLAFVMKGPAHELPVPDDWAIHNAFTSARRTDADVDDLLAKVLDASSAVGNIRHTPSHTRQAGKVMRYEDVENELLARRCDAAMFRRMRGDVKRAKSEGRARVFYQVWGQPGRCSERPGRRTLPNSLGAIRLGTPNGDKGVAWGMGRRGNVGHGVSAGQHRGGCS